MSSFALGPTAYSRSFHEASDHSVPVRVSAKSAIGRPQIGRFNDCSNALRSRNGASETRNADAKIATSVVDQGSEAATRIAKTSDVVDHAAGSRHNLDNKAGADFFDHALTRCLRGPA